MTRKLASTSKPERHGWKESEREQREFFHTSDRSGNGRVGDTIVKGHARLFRSRNMELQRTKEPERPASKANFWDSSTTIKCRDGKLRRIPAEPALFPLAPGIPGRVGILRGAGNAINPWIAAEFVKAFMEILKQGGQR